MSNYNFLVLLELTLLQKEKEILDKQKKSFNPCFIGTYSITKITSFCHSYNIIVLILVLLELTLLHSSTIKMIVYNIKF